MIPEAEQPDQTAEVEADAAQRSTRAADAVPAKAEPKRRAGVPVWRTGKPDAYLAAAVDAARTAIEGITAARDIGEHIAARSEGDRLVTHLFESLLPGYLGWQWYAVLTRNSRSKVVTVNELGLLPSEESILAPEWVPWAERVRPEDAQEADAEETGGRGPEAAADVPDALEAGEPGALEPDTEALDAGEPDAVERDAEAQDPEDFDGGAPAGEGSGPGTADGDAFDDEVQDLEDPRSEREAD